MQTDRFPDNTRSKFKSNIDINHLKNTPDQNIEVAVKSIMYDSSISFKKFYCKPTKPDIVILKKYPKNEFKLTNNIRFKRNMTFVPIYSEDIKNFDHFEDAYVFDMRKDSNELKLNKFVIRRAHQTFSSINLLIDDNENSTYLIQMIFLADRTIKSNLELNELLKYIYKNNIFFKDVQESKLLDKLILLFGEQLSHSMSIKPGNSVRNYRNLTNLFEDDIKDQFETAIEKSLEDKELKFYLSSLVHNRSEQMYTRWTTTQLYSGLNILKQDVLGLRTSIADFSIRGNKFDKITAIWNASTLKDNIVKIDFKNPPFFKTSKEKLSNANFEIVNFTTEEQPCFGIGSPTYVHCIVKGIENSGMKQPFNVLLDSNCAESKKLFPQNTATDFKIKLAERISFNKNWMVSLQSLFLSNKLFNISGEMFNFQCEEKIKQSDYNKVRKYYNLKEDDEFPGCKYSDFWESRKLPYFKCKKGAEITAGCYTRLEELIEVIQDDWEKKHFNLTIKVVNQRVKIENKNKNLFDITLEISPYLAYALGFTEQLDLNSSSVFHIKDSVTSTFKSKLSVFTPKYLIICCDIVDDTIFSGEHVKLLRMVVNNTAQSEEIISFEFLHHDFVPLAVKEFSSIHITITDVSGSPILSNSISPTYLQLVFANM